MDPVSYLYAPLVKVDKREDGSLLVHGKATGSELDIDQQICDPKWLAKAMPEWFASGANVREMHQPIAAGLGKTLEVDGDSYMLESLIVDPGSIAKVQAEVLKGYSIGIKSPRVVKDVAAPNGRIVGGTIVEVSLVDRPANPTAKMSLVKAADTEVLVGGELLEDADAIKAAEADLAKKDFDDDERKRLADAGKAMPDGSFPIPNVASLKDAIRAIGRAKDPARAKAWIKRRAKQLKRTDLLPDGWKGADADLEKADGEWTHDPTQLAAIRDGLVGVMKAELDEFAKGDNETSDISELFTALSEYLYWWQGEAAEGETTSPFESTAAKASLADAIKAVLASQPTILTDLIPPAEIVTKTVTAEDDTTKAAAESRIAELEGRLAQVEQMARPGGPVRTREAVDVGKSAQSDELRNLIAHYREQALTIGDPDLVKGYRSLQADAERDLAKLTAA